VSAVLGVVLVVVGVFVLIIAAVSLHEFEKYDAWVRLEATVISVSHTTQTVGNGVGGVSVVDRYDPTLRFSIDVKEQTVEGGDGATAYVAGQVVDVFVNPGDPSTVLLQLPTHEYGMALLAVASGVVSVVVGVWLIWRKVCHRGLRELLSPTGS